MASVQLYDTTLRDGAGREGISFSMMDKIHITKKLDELGIHYIEGGWPGSNLKDVELFEKARRLKLANSVLVAFGSTWYAKTKVEDDANLQALANAGFEGTNPRRQHLRVALRKALLRFYPSLSVIELVN